MIKSTQYLKKAQHCYLVKLTSRRSQVSLKFPAFKTPVPPWSCHHAQFSRDPAMVILHETHPFDLKKFIIFLAMMREIYAMTVRVSSSGGTYVMSWSIWFQRVADSVTDAVSVRAFWISLKSCYWFFTMPDLYIMTQSQCSVTCPPSAFLHTTWVTEVVD